MGLSRWIGTLALSCAIWSSWVLAYTAKEISEQARLYSVRVTVTHKSAFSVRPQGKHGSGFLFHQDDQFFYFFTNEHVANRPLWAKELIFVDTFVDPTHFERAPAERYFVSPFSDVAVVRVRRSQLPRTGDQLVPGRLAQKSFFDQNLVQREVLVIGNPYDVANTTTKGTIISAEHHIDRWGKTIASDAPINPGNSGGPMVDIETGLILGIASAGINNADGMGFVVPIYSAEGEWRRRLTKADADDERSIIGGMQLLRRSEVVARGVRDLLRAEGISAKFLDTFDGMFSCVAVPEEGPLQVGDLVVSADGTLVGEIPVRLFEAINQSERSTVTMQVVRQGRLVTLEVPIANLGQERRAGEASYLRLAGLHIGELDSNQAFGLTRSGSRVVVAGVLPGSVASAREMDYYRSVVVSAEIGTERVPIRRLEDLKQFIARMGTSDKVVKLGLHRPLAAGETSYVMDYRFDHVMLDPAPVDRTFPLVEISTDADVSMAELLRRVNITGFDEVVDASVLSAMSAERALGPCLHELIDPMLGASQSASAGQRRFREMYSLHRQSR